MSVWDHFRLLYCSNLLQWLEILEPESTGGVEERETGGIGWQRLSRESFLKPITMMMPSQNRGQLSHELYEVHDWARKTTKDRSNRVRCC